MHYFTETFLPHLASRRPEVIENLEHCRCEVRADREGIEVTFRLGSLFDAIWRTANEDAIELPHNSDWGKDFKEFCQQLMSPWPEQAFARAGFKCSLVHKSNRNVTTIYRLSHNKGFNRTPESSGPAEPGEFGGGAG